MKIIFFGSDDFAAVHLKTLIQSKHQVVACVTQPDRPKGRGMKLGVSPIKVMAIESNLSLLQPQDLKGEAILTQLKNFQADLFVVIAYGCILPKAVLSIPRLFCINVHSSLLPKYRGAAPINWAVINGDKETGITVIKMSPLLDAGDIIAQSKMKIEASDTALSLREKMMGLGPGFLLKTVEDLSKNNYTLIPQDDKFVTQAPKLTKELGKIDWVKSASEIHNLVRGLLPWPTAHTIFKDKILKLLETQVLKDERKAGSPGEVEEVHKDGITVATGNGRLLVKKVHFESSRPMDAHRFVIGHNLKKGFIFK